MKKHPRPYIKLSAAFKATNTLWIQPPLPFCPHTLPKLAIIEGQGSGRGHPSPLAPPGAPATALDPTVCNHQR